MEGASSQFPFDLDETGIVESEATKMKSPSKVSSPQEIATLLRLGASPGMVGVLGSSFGGSGASPTYASALAEVERFRRMTFGIPSGKTTQVGGGSGSASTRPTSGAEIEKEGKRTRRPGSASISWVPSASPIGGSSASGSRSSRLGDSLSKSNSTCRPLVTKDSTIEIEMTGYAPGSLSRSQT